MPLFEFEETEALGRVQSVDTSSVMISVGNLEVLKQMQVNRLVVLESSKAGQHLIGIIERIRRNSSKINDSGDQEPSLDQVTEINLVKIVLIGTFIDRVGTRSNVFRRTLETVPEIMAHCYALEGDRLTNFMRSVSQLSREETQRLSLGKYTLDEAAEAYLNGNKFFQRHAFIVGSTGSGKSWTTAHILEQISTLSNANCIVFDIHGEYSTLTGDGFRHLRVAGPSDLSTTNSLDEGVLYLPYWLLSYEDMIDLLLDRSDQNAPNQAMVFSRTVTKVKREYLETGGHTEILENFTIDSPVPYSIESVVTELSRLNTQMVPGSGSRMRQGDFHGKLSRFLARLENKISDRRLGFMFKGPESIQEFDWLNSLSKILLAGTKDQNNEKGGVKIIDFSEVPSDVLPIIISLVARIVLTIQQWTQKEDRHPIALFCDEAHLYITDNPDSSGPAALRTFTRVAKEGRKYGVGLIVISQRPSEVNRTVLSQCNNVIAMRLSNAEDQLVVKRLLPDSLGGFSDILPILDVGEALVVGDACLLPSRIRITEPTNKPDSGTVDFWDEWSTDESVEKINDAVSAWRKQSLQ